MHQLYSAKNRENLVALARRSRIALASHDDATVEQVQEAIADGVSIAEFPTTLEAAARSHDAGIRVLMGAPNVVRGGSHSGNIAAQELAVDGMLDILSSDYVPSSLLLAAFELPERAPSFDIAKAIRLVTANPAAASGLLDRGEIVVGKRADLVRVATHGVVPVVRTVWREGVRVV
jgi:alpha-D-ribose 1-methylphosphonate 5-triphosphate diphosphatase